MDLIIVAVVFLLIVALLYFLFLIPKKKLEKKPWLAPPPEKKEPLRVKKPKISKSRLKTELNEFIVQKTELASRSSANVENKRRVAFGLGRIGSILSSALDRGKLSSRDEQDISDTLAALKHRMKKVFFRNAQYDELVSFIDYIKRNI